MKCKVCGAESGKYPLCRECNKKKESGEVIKCPKCQKWHDTNAPCIEEIEEEAKDVVAEKEKFLYELKPSMVTKTEKEYLNCIKAVLPENCLVQAQANLASFIVRTDGAKFQNELYRNVDFIITDLLYKPLLVIEINDRTHLTEERRKRDKKVADICEEAGIPMIKLWTSYGVNQEYIAKRITESLASLPAKRVHHFEKAKEIEPEKKIETQKDTENSAAQTEKNQVTGKKGCYIATCVYGSYDCPQVWTLRRFRDDRLEKSRFGRAFIKIYYAVSPTLVKWFGDKERFRAFWKKYLDSLVLRLQGEGIKDTPYMDFQEAKS